MRHNRKKINQSIMYGIVAMALVVMLVVFIFMYMFIDKKAAQNEESGNPAQTEQLD